MGARRYVYFQPNKKDLKDEFGDCTVRALAKTLDVSWIEAFDKMIPICRREQVPNVFYAPAKIKNAFMNELGFDYVGISNKTGSKRPTVDEFARDHKVGRFICNVANHEVAVVDGKYYDTWDSGHKSLYGYYVLRGGN